MDHLEIRRIRGALSRAAFARLLGVTSLTVLRWELPEDNKEARRPRAKMVELLRKLAAEGVGHGPTGVDAEDDEEDVSEPAAPVAGQTGESTVERDSLIDERLLQPMLEQLCTEHWRRAEDDLTGLLSSNGLGTRVGRALATLGLVQTQILAHMDLRGALAVLVPILDEASRGELPDEVAGRAHVMATFVFAAPDSRFHDLGRVNAHAARAGALLPADADDLRIMSATSCIAASRYLGPEVTLHAYKTHLPYLERSRSPLSRMLADALAGLVATVRNDTAVSAEAGGRALEAAEALGHWGLVMGILSDYAHQILRGSQTPDAALQIARHGRGLANSASLAPTEGFIRLLAAECEALCRLARFEEALAAAGEALALAQRAGLARYSLTATLARLYLFSDRLPELKALTVHYEQESLGAHRSAARVHLSYMRGVLAALEGRFADGRDLFDVVCDAPDSTPGLEYIVHSAHFEATVARALLHDEEGAQAALRRFDELLELRPSVWHSLMARRADALIMVRRGQLSEARLRIESTVATFALLGDSVQSILEEGSRNLIAAATGAPDVKDRVAATFARLAALGVSSTFLERLAHYLVEPIDNSWREQTMAEKLVVAAERLNVKGLEPSAFLRELAAVPGFLFPGHQALVGGAELRDVATTVEVVGEAGDVLRFGVRGALDAEQRAFLVLLGGIAARRPVSVPVPVEPELALDGALPEFVAAAPATRQLKSEILRLSRSRATILISGESGSGKEVVARAVHDVSQRAGEAYVTFNCASVPRELFEGQLFGYRKGAFTGATTDSPGVIRAADGGTLFLDEVGELPLDMQPKLLRFLENGEVLPIGEVKPKRVDVRIVAATHRDLDRLVREGRFREDLYYRLNVVPVRVPPLRERKEDVSPLARLFIRRLAETGATAPRLGPSAVRALQEHSWPGNVRELRNVLERAMAYSPVPSELRAEHLRIAGA